MSADHNYTISATFAQFINAWISDSLDSTWTLEISHDQFYCSIHFPLIHLEIAKHFSWCVCCWMLFLLIFKYECLASVLCNPGVYKYFDILLYVNWSEDTFILAICRLGYIRIWQPQFSFRIHKVEWEDNILFDSFISSSSLWVVRFTQLFAGCDAMSWWTAEQIASWRSNLMEMPSASCFV